MTLQEQIQEVNDRLQYWEKEVEELAGMGKLEEIADVYQEARSQVSLCMDELISLQDELNSSRQKNQLSGAGPIELKLYSLRFYTDGPGGLMNKFFCYSVHHGGHAADLLTKFISKGLTIKAAYMVGGTGGERGVQLGRGELAYLTCTREVDQARARAILLSKFPRLSNEVVKKGELLDF